MGAHRLTEPLRQAVRAVCRRDETACVADLADELARSRYDRKAAAAQARSLIEAVRRQRSTAGGVDHLMHEFSLSSAEGVALMCLAEALLRIPDTATADRLIRDKLSRGDWHAHLGGSASLFVNAATWGLMLAGKLVAPHSHGALGAALSAILVKSGEPVIRKSMDFAMRLLGQQFVMAETIAAALGRSELGSARGYSHSFDMLGEAALTQADADRYASAYGQAIEAIGAASAGRGVVAGPGISVKLSALHPRYTRSQRARVMAELVPRLRKLALRAKGYDIGFNIDAEEADRLELSLDVLEALAADPALSAWQGLGFVVQAYQKRCPFVIAWLIELARRTGRRLMIRLVKGAYWDSEVKRTQVDGLSDYPVFTRKAHTDLCYLACAARMLAAPAEIYAQFATHNAHTLASVAQMARERSNEDYEFQCLYGMGEPLYDNVVGAGGLGRRCRIYAPVGSHDTLLPYLVRRLLENGANASFVNRVVDENVGVEELIEDPLDAVGRTGGGCHPAIPLPRALYGERVNSAGVDLCDEPTIAALEDALDRSSDTVWHAAPLVPGALTPAGEARQIVNPADRSKPVGTVIDANAETIEQALANAAACASRWAQTPPSVRAAALERAADLLQSRRLQFVSLCLREAGKTWSGAIAEVREAIDYCRYYAWRLAHCDWSVADAAPGPAVCISPWNFPLAIFVGEVSAALAAGSPVIAKPAEQTPLIAHLAVQLLRRAGIPAQVLQFVPGPGETVGARLVADARVKSVIFTGSCEVAHRIDRSIAGRPGVRLIAETGGINAMIVDSSALPEQVVQDVLSSGFDSAGQRCSALRVLCLQDDIAERTIVMLRAAMRELAIGDPARLSTDIGPIIDPEAHARIEAHIERMRTLGHGVFQPQLPAACARGCYLPPTLIEIASFAQLQHEVFGPVVHVLRFDAERLPQLVDDINASGYGLTLGIQSRIDETVELVTARARVGNIYVNRSMIGAVVGVQPFGGEGRSGTGPKAGGPLYLYRLAGADRVTPAMIGAPAVADLAAQPVALRELSQWAVASGRAELAALCDDYGAQSLLQARLDLPGPTGERNTLHFAPRGCLLCSAVDAPALLHQLAAVFASGNRAAVVDTPQSNAVLVQLPSELAAAIDRRAPADHAGLAGVLSEVDDAALARRLAALPGSSIPLICPHPRSRRYPLYRMLVERVVSVNTTAAGGNAALMAMPA